MKVVHTESAGMVMYGCSHCAHDLHVMLGAQYVDVLGISCYLIAGFEHVAL